MQHSHLYVSDRSTLSLMGPSSNGPGTAATDGNSPEAARAAASCAPARASTPQPPSHSKTGMGHANSRMHPSMAHFDHSKQLALDPDGAVLSEDVISIASLARRAQRPHGPWDGQGTSEVAEGGPIARRAEHVREEPRAPAGAAGTNGTGTGDRGREGGREDRPGKASTEQVLGPGSMGGASDPYNGVTSTQLIRMRRHGVTSAGRSSKVPGSEPRPVSLARRSGTSWVAAPCTGGAA